MATALSNLSEYDASAIPNGSSFEIHIVVSQWNASITHALYDGAKDTLLKAGVQFENIKQWNVPGSFELIGSIIQGETKHFDFVCNAVAQGIKDLNIQSDIPVIFCVLTDNTLQQARDRSGGKHGNKGVEAAVAALQMANLQAK